MKDQETLDTHAIKDNMTIHLVVKTGTPQQSVASRQVVETKRIVDARKPPVDPKKPVVDPKKPTVDPKTDVDPKKGVDLVDIDGEDKKKKVEEKATINPAQTLFGLDGIYGLPGMAGMDMGTVNYLELQQQMKEGIKSNPELFRRQGKRCFY